MKLTRRRWLLPVLVELHDGATARVPELAHRLAASRGGVAEAMLALVDLDLMARVPAPRHPLQPELLLTTAGATLAAKAADLGRMTDTLQATEILRSRWSLPIVAALARPRRFNDLRRDLPGITDRALALALAALVDQGLVVRSVDADARPPATRYSLAPHAMPLAAPLAKLG